MTPQEVLNSLGLNQKESAVYLACLELGQESITEISKKAGVKRPTTYLVLDSLQKRGLIHTVVKGKRILFGAEEPTKLMGMIAEKERFLHTIMPYLEAINNRKSEKPKIRFYEGREGLMRVYDEMFVAKEMRFWGSMNVISKDFQDVIDWFTEKSKKEKPRVYDLLTDTPKDREYAKNVIRQGYEIRFFPKDLEVVVDSMIVENKVSINAFSPSLHGLIIESEPIAKSMLALWEMAWRSATPYSKLIKK